MTEFELITLVLSVIAILLSGFNTYITFFYKKNSLVGGILSFGIPDKNTPTPASIDIECSLSNTGQRELLVRDVSIVPEDGTGVSIVPVLKRTGIPCVLKPNQITLVKFYIPVLFANTLAFKKIPIPIEFEITSSDGKTYIASKRLEFIEEEHGLSIKDNWRDTFSMRLQSLII